MRKVLKKRPGAWCEKGYRTGFSKEEKTCGRHLTRAEWRRWRITLA
jgi:hypothetical protein